MPGREIGGMIAGWSGIARASEADQGTGEPAADVAGHGDVQDHFPASDAATDLEAAGSDDADLAQIVSRPLEKLAFPQHDGRRVPQQPRAGRRFQTREEHGTPEDVVLIRAPPPAVVEPVRERLHLSELLPRQGRGRPLA